MIIYSQQYYIARLQLSMVEVETDCEKYRKLNQAIEDLVNKQGALEQYIQDFGGKLESLEKEYNKIVEDDKGLRENFESALQEKKKITDPVVLKECKEIYNIRNGKRHTTYTGLSSRTSQISSFRSGYNSVSRSSMFSSRASYYYIIL